MLGGKHCLISHRTSRAAGPCHVIFPGQHWTLPKTRIKLGNSEGSACLLRCLLFMLVILLGSSMRLSEFGLILNSAMLCSEMSSRCEL